MTKTILLLIVSVILFSCNTHLKKAGLTDVDWSSDTVEAYNTFYEVFYSTSAKSDVSFHIFLPDVYFNDTTLRLPVIYWLHGAGSCTKGIKPLTKIFSTAISRGLIPPLILVFPNGLPYGMWCNSKDGKQPVEDIFIKDLIPYVDSTYRTIANSSGRVVEGFSMGGYGTGRFAFRYPDLFEGFSIIAGGPLRNDFADESLTDEYIEPFVYEEVYGNDPDYFRSQSPFYLASFFGNKLPAEKPLRIIAGKDDFVYQENLNFHNHLTNLGIKHRYYEFEGLGHRVPPLIKAMGDTYWEFYNEVFE